MNTGPARLPVTSSPVVITVVALSMIALSAVDVRAESCDTLIVQTFEFSDIETRRATFDFPDDDRTWQRILMRYTLKCDEATVGDSYPCGEWDVNTYTIAHVHTGVFDSTLRLHPSFIVEGESPSELRYSDSPRFHYVTYWDDPDGPVPSDHYLHFDGTDCITVPPEALAGIDSSITVSFWMRGDPDQPINDHIIEAGNTGGRVLNIHLPWGNGVVYWDAGGRLSGNNNRLSKSPEPAHYKGRWNHWAFTKDARTGEMRIYLNGELWHRAGNMTKAMFPIDSFTIGANLNRNGGWYAGGLDDIRIWDIALDEETVAHWQHRPVTPAHPSYEHLRAEYRFDDPTDLENRRAIDSSPHGHDGESFGQPQRVPFGYAGRSALKPGPTTVLRTDSIPAPRLSVKLFEDERDPQRLTRVMNVWPAYDSWFDGDGNWLEDKPIETAQTLTQVERTSFSEPFEIVEEYELARFITPYGKRLDLGDDGFTWVYDVTGYAPLLRGRVDLQAANTFELLDLKFVFIEGTPPRRVRDIKNLWPKKNYRYSDLVDETEVRPIAVDLDPDAAGFLVRSRISGHGHAGPRHCCEWDPKEHILKVAGLERFRWNVWRDCGMNPVHPQGGTWQFDRAGWCPGTFVDTYDHELTPWVMPGDEVAIDYTVEPYDPDIFEDDGRFVVSHQLFTYDPPSFELDAAIVDIIAPSAHDEYRRFNPVPGEALIRIRNVGRRPLRSLVVHYGLEDGRQSRYEWSGELTFLESERVTLPAPDWAGMKTGSRFQASVALPNGEQDDNRCNDRMSMEVAAPHILPTEFIIHVESPGFGRAADNSYTITDGSGDIVASRDTFKDDAVTDDRMALEPGAYTFSFLDSEEDGMIRHWWLRGSAPDEIGENGALMILSAEGDSLLDLGYDFAEKRVLRFFVGEPR